LGVEIQNGGSYLHLILSGLGERDMVILYNNTSSLDSGSGCPRRLLFITLKYGDGIQAYPKHRDNSEL
jgi:hypothetical protein